jgi:hypothetical protein
MPLDIGVGIILSLGAAQGFGVEATPMFMTTGILFALLPDIDILPIFWRTSYDHRSYPHYPIVHVPIAIGIYMLFGPVFTTLYVLCLLAHFIHDTVGLGWGIAWLWPFSRRRFIFLPAARMSRGWFQSWLPEEETTFTYDYRVDSWIRYYYFRPSPVAFIEYGVVSIALLLLAIYYAI